MLGGKKMETDELRNQIRECLHQREYTTDKLRNYAHKLYQQEHKVPNPTIGWKQMLRELGFIL